jgi:TonB family protein
MRQSLTNLLRALAAAALLVLPTIPALASGVKVIANSSVKPDSITSAEVKNLFLEETNSLSDGSHVEPVLQKPGATRDAFAKEYLDRSDAELRTYYLGLAFTGKGFVPKEFRSDADVVAFVARMKSAIGYVSSSANTQGVKTLFVITKATSQERTLLRRVEPVYPDVLHRLHIGGVVRLQLMISPKGSVEKIIVLGGNPILGEAATTAVQQWVYVPGPSPTTSEVSIPFDPKR